MIHNPELRRNIWLDFSIHRIFLTPLILGLIAYLAYLSSGKGGATLVFYNACFFIFLWGTKLASETVIEEVNNNTWDFQRQSAISPWSMTLGKWLGSTLFTWYGAGICLLYYVLIHLKASTTTPGLAQEISLLVLGGLFAQALALLLSLQILPQVRHEHSNKTFRYFFAAAMIGIIATSLCLHAQKGTSTLSWHRININEGSFFAISLLLFLGWTVIGLYRSFSKELQYQNIPWIWLLFNVFCMAYFSGFASFENLNLNNTLINLQDIKNLLQNTPYYLAFSVITILTYLSLFADNLSSIRYRKLLARLSENNFNEVLQLIPWWAISFGLAILMGLWTSVTQTRFEASLKEVIPGIFILTSLLFLLRDILLVHYFMFSKNAKRAQSAALLYLAVLWIALPLLIQTLHFEHLFPMLLPSWGQNTPLALVSVLTQIAVFGLLCWNKWEQTWQKV